jgi:ATP phosphoribosyltransferase
MDSNGTSPLVIALTKGRIMQQLAPILKASEIHIKQGQSEENKLVLDSECGQYRFLMIRGSDATTYVRLGAADLGIVGKDMLLEHGYQNLYELLDLGIGRCRIMTAAKKDVPTREGVLRIAAKYVNIARDFYRQRNQPVQIIPLYGALELAPIVGISDQIVDIVDTGKTLKSNGLVPLEHIADISTRLIANKAAMKFRHKDIGLFKERISANI